MACGNRHCPAACCEESLFKLPCSWRDVALMACVPLHLQEDDRLVALVKQHGSEWADTAALMPGRTRRQCKGGGGGGGGR